MHCMILQQMVPSFSTGKLSKAVIGSSGSAPYMSNTCLGCHPPDSFLSVAEGNGIMVTDAIGMVVFTAQW